MRFSGPFPGNIPPPYLELWFYRLLRSENNTGPVWGLVGSDKYRLRRSTGPVYAANFYAEWTPHYAGTRIDGYFDLGPIERLSLGITLAATLVLSIVGVLLNTLDLTRGTHFTNDPQFGLLLSILFVPFYVGFYLLAKRRGSRSDDRLLAFLETTLAARRAE